MEELSCQVLTSHIFQRCYNKSAWSQRSPEGLNNLSTERKLLSIDHLKCRSQEREEIMLSDEGEIYTGLTFCFVRSTASCLFHTINIRPIKVKFQSVNTAPMTSTLWFGQTAWIFVIKTSILWVWHFHGYKSAKIHRLNKD